MCLPTLRDFNSISYIGVNLTLYRFGYGYLMGNSFHDIHRNVAIGSIDYKHCCFCFRCSQLIGGGGAGMFSALEWIMKGAVWLRAGAVCVCWTPDGAEELWAGEPGFGQPYLRHFTEK
jgi:hypothetical protein